MKSSSFYIYGRKPVIEQINNNPGNILRIFISDRVNTQDLDIEGIKQYAKKSRIPCNVVGEKHILSYVGDVNDQGVIALIKEPEYADFNDWLTALDTDTNPVVVLLDHIEDTHNFGAILRTATAVGAAGVIVAKDHQSPLNATVFKTSAGTATRIPIVQVANINQTIKRLQEERFWVAGVDMPESKKDFVWNQTFDTPMAFVVGGEGSGLSPKTKEHCDFIVALPMENEVESLNVSVATACILYEWKRQQQK